MFGRWLAMVLLGSTAVFGQLVPQSGAGPAPTAGTLSGRVIEAVTRRPIVGANMVMVSDQGEVQATTGAGGAFTVRQLAPGSYTVSVHRSGYFDSAFAQPWPTGPSTRLEIAANENVEGVEFTLWPSGAVRGSVADDRGVPLQGLRVYALRSAFEGGTWRVVVAGAAATDDQGEYVISGLHPGAYKIAVLNSYLTLPQALIGAVPPEIVVSEGLVLFVRPPTRSDGVEVGDRVVVPLGPTPRPVLVDSQSAIYPTTFFPDVTSYDQANDLILGAGEERRSVDFVLARRAGQRLVGRIEALSGVPPPPMLLRLLLPGVDDQRFLIAATATDDQGRFAFEGVFPGDYLLRGHRRSVGLRGDQAGGASTTWVTSNVHIGQASTAEIILLADSGSAIAGWVQAGGDPGAEFDPASLTVSFEPKTGPRVAAGLFGSRVATDGSFEVPSVPAGDYFVRVLGAPPEVMADVKSLTVPTEPRGPLVITLSGETASVNGSVHASPETSLSSGCLVLVFPATPALHSGYGRSPVRFRAVAAGRDGAFSMVGLPPGDYLIAAVRGDVDQEWMEPDALAALLPVAKPLSLAPGANGVSVTLALIRR